MKVKCKLQGGSLVELLIVVAILGMLLQLILPAVEMSREASRRTHCQNNLRQIGVACQLHLGATGRFPSGGWGFSWAGDPDRGDDRRQPGGWIYNILPYVEQQPLYFRGKGEAELAKKENAALVCKTPLSLFTCTSRRLPRLYPFDEFSQRPMRNTMFLDKAAKTDYAANAGDHFSHGYPGPLSLADGDSPAYLWDNPKLPGCMPSKSTGPIYLRSEVRTGQVTDGMSNTYLVGEKYLNPDRYKDGVDGGDDQVMFSGFDADVNRFVVDILGNEASPQRDRKGDESRYLFGSAHPDGCNFVRCDGSVRTVSYSIDGEAHRALGNRHDELLTHNE